MSDRVRAALSSVVDGHTLTLDEARDAMGSVMDGEATPALLAALLVALRMRGETVDELAGFATAMRERVLRVDAPAGAIDTCGTGGDGSGTFNISTTAALVVAAAGVPVAKHGNRAMTSRSGSADVLDALGVRIDHDEVSAAAALRDTGLRVPLRDRLPPGDEARRPDPPRDRRPDRVQPPRPAHQPGRRPPPGDRRAGPGGRGEAGRRAGAGSAWIARSSSAARGSTSCRSTGRGVIHDVTPEGIEVRTVDAAALGLTKASNAKLAGGTPEENARIVESVLRGEPGARRDVVVLNAGAALVVAGVVDDLAAGIERAALTIDAGLATELLERLRAERRAAEAARPPVAEGAPA